MSDPSFNLPCCSFALAPTPCSRNRGGHWPSIPEHVINDVIVIFYNACVADTLVLEKKGYEYDSNTEIKGKRDVGCTGKLNKNQIFGAWGTVVRSCIPQDSVIIVFFAFSLLWRMYLFLIYQMLSLQCTSWPKFIIGCQKCICTWSTYNAKN